MTCERDNHPIIDGQNGKCAKRSLRYFSQEEEALIVARCRAHHADRNHPTMKESYLKMAALIQHVNSGRLHGRLVPLRTPSSLTFHRVLREVRVEGETLDRRASR
ncbi:hypothetical protein GGQ64_004824 [Rhizobium azooxidifex]|uniref:Uncharacterized protein n=1 Tax=Mycoplana azooxidifex TaxID=1636188 RepID=A0A7W6GLD4_9HYPH|nr:hypothetical protein [Mycoplana azooxidifex]